MKSRLRSLLPRLIGATVIAGVASFMMFTIFKLLLGVTLLAAGITMVSRSIDRRRERQFRFEQQGMPAFGEPGLYNKPVQFNDDYTPQFAQSLKGTTIVPIN